MVTTRKPVDGTCCSCGNRKPEETPCAKREDKIHCVHWWDGSEYMEVVEMPGGKKPKRPTCENRRRK